MLFLFKNGNENDAPAQRAGLFASYILNHGILFHINSKDE